MYVVLWFTTRFKLSLKIALLPVNKVINHIKIGTIAYFKYFLFWVKSIAFTNGIGCNSSDF